MWWGRSSFAANCLDPPLLDHAGQEQGHEQQHADDAGGEGDGKQRRDALAYQADRKHDADLCHDTHCKNSFGIFTKRTVIIIAQY